MPTSTNSSDIPLIDKVGLSSKSDTEHAGLFAATLKCRAAVTESTINMVVDNAIELVSNVVDNVNTELNRYIDNNSIDLTSQQKTEIFQIFEMHRNPFKGIETTFLREQYYIKNFKFISPQEFVLGTRIENSLTRKDSTLKQRTVVNALYYISPIDVLKMILSKEHTRDLLNKNTVGVENKLNDYSDGLHCKNHPLFSKYQDAFKICLYTDEIETVNPLGSKTKIHKLGLVYFVIKNFPFYLNSRLDFIHTSIVYHAADQRRYGWHAVLDPLIRDIRKLESGVVIFVNDVHITIRGAVVALCADNLAANSVLGFVESFSANFPCRFCLMPRNEKMQSVFMEDETLLRNQVNYDEDVQNSSAAGNSRGVKSMCPLNELQYFHCTSNSVVDIMHDLCEGFFKHEVKYFLSYFVNSAKQFSLDTLNSRIRSFSWGFNDRRNKPCEISKDEIRSNRCMKGKASEMWCLLRNLPVLIGDLVADDDQVWLLLCQLLKISSVIFSPSCTIAVTYYLKHLIDDHLLLFKDLFPLVNIIPKQHFMIHYPRMIRIFGPLCHMWCMRFEGKHLYAKQLCSTVKCFKNIAKTVAHRYQHEQMMSWVSGTISTNIQFGKGQSVLVRNLSERHSILHSIPNCSDMTEVYTCEQCTVNGMCYRAGSAVLIGEECPVTNSIALGLILYCFVIQPETSVYLVCKELVSNEYDSHFCGYFVNVQSATLNVKILKDSELKYPWPLDIVQGFTPARSYVSLRYQI